MPLDLPLRCRCGRMRGVASDVSQSSGFRFVCYCRDCQAFARFLERADVLDPAGGTDIFQMPPARVKLVAGTDAMRCLRLSNKGLALVRRLLSDPDCQHRHRAALPGHRRGSFLHEPRGRRSFPGRSPRSAALPHLRTLRRRASPAQRARSAVARDFRPPCVKAARLVGARPRSADAVLRRSDEGSARRAARAHAERARRALTRLVDDKTVYDEWAKKTNAVGLKVRRIVRVLDPSLAE
jgi:hypothetical protein